MVLVLMLELEQGSLYRSLSPVGLGEIINRTEEGYRNMASFCWDVLMICSTKRCILT